ncbi:MAG: hypothetical protein HQK75_17965 [Candidatus Magnetomorum sp.]|nr:hypothetical protein [Candidatus Magnetomorum sp.]
MTFLKKQTVIIVTLFMALWVTKAFSEMDWISKQLVEQKFVPSDLLKGEMFGSSVAISDKYAVIGAKNDDDKAGSIYIFEKVGTKWEMIQKFTNDSPTQNAYMGLSVATTGNFIFAGESCFDLDEEHKDLGAVHVYYRQSSGEWTKIQRVLPNPVENTHRFGTSMSVLDDTLIIGAYGETDESGKAFIFQQDGNQWRQVQCLEPEEPIIKGRFGNAVNISSDFVIVGAYLERDYLGGAYIFQKIDGSWQQTTKLLPPEEQKYSYFGYSVDINDTYAIVGAYGCKTSDDITNAGAVYIFKRGENAWEFLLKLTENDLGKSDKFGTSLDLENNVLMVGATKMDSSVVDSGAVFFYRLENDTCIKLNKIFASDATTDALFGQSFALQNNYFVVGANLTNDQNVRTGGVYVYEPFSYQTHPLGPDGVVSLDDIIHWLKNLSSPDVDN